MNKENIKLVRDAIAAEATVVEVAGFNMSSFGGCGTPGCIAGYCGAFAEVHPYDVDYYTAADFFDIHGSQSYDLCMPDQMDDITSTHAVEMLDWLLSVDEEPSAYDIATKWQDIVSPATN